MRPCWYRAFVDNRPEGIVVDSVEYFDVLCADLTGLQREACVTAVSVIGPADPAQQLELCAQLAGPGDAASCVRGTKVQNLLGAPVDTFVRLIGGCEAFCRRLRAAPATAGSGRRSRSSPTARSPAPAARSSPERPAAECAAGARTVDDALVTFS